MSSDEDLVDNPTGWVAQHIRRYVNLVAHPEVEVEVRGESFPPVPVRRPRASGRPGRSRSWSSSAVDSEGAETNA
jgi:hypothetical protein